MFFATPEKATKKLITTHKPTTYEYKKNLYPNRGSNNLYAFKRMLCRRDGG